MSGYVGDIYSYKLIPENIALDAITRIERHCDVDVDAYTDNVLDHLEHDCIFMTPGTKRVKAFLYAENNPGIPYPSEETLSIYSASSCYAPDPGSFYTCDMDSDDRPDLCDEDIDGDGFLNEWIDLLRFEQDDCAINATNINLPRLAEYYQAIRDGADFDTCPFVVNPEQQDSDGDGR